MLTFRKKVFAGSAALLVSGFIGIRFGLSGEIVFFLNGLSAWILFYQLSRPIQRILDHFKGDHLQPIDLDLIPKGEFRHIVRSRNSLIGKIKVLEEHVKLKVIESEEILESISEGIIAIDAQGNVIFANRAACKLLKISGENLLGAPLSTQTDLLARCHEMIQHVLQTSEPNAQTWDKHLDLIARPRQARRGVILVVQDMTSHYKVLEMDKEFIANASHELRTPITIIQGFAETLRDHPKLSTQTIGEVSEKIVRTSQRLENLIQGLLALANVDNFSEHRLAAVDLIPIVENCRDLLLTVHPQARVSFSSEMQNAHILAAPQLIDLAVMNLLENGVKYSPHPPNIQMSVQAAGSDVRIEVRDRGIGIPEAELSYIFDRFYTVDKARSRKSGGTGLGLSIVKTIVEKHKGSVSVASQLGVGSSFTICLPLKKPL